VPTAADREAWNAGVERSARAFCDNVAPMLAVFGEGAVERAAVRAGARVLDVGCASGIVTAACALRAGPRGLVVGADESQGFVEAARRGAARNGGGPRPRFVRGAPEGLPLAEASVDAVVSAFGLPAWDAQREFAEAFRVLRPGGALSLVHMEGGRIAPMAAVEGLLRRFATEQPSAGLRGLRHAAGAVDSVRGVQRHADALEGAARLAGFGAVRVGRARVRQRLWGITNFLDVCLSYPLPHAEHAELAADAKELFVTAGQEVLLPHMDLEEFIATADLVYVTATRPARGA